MSEYIDECPDYNVTNKTSLEALEDVKIAPNFMGGNRKYLCFTQSSSPFLKDITIIEKELKALEIIKRNPYHLICIYLYNTYDAYASSCFKHDDNYYTEEEFNFLKEVMLGGK